MMSVPGLACAFAIALQLNFGLAVAAASTEAQQVEPTPMKGNENPSQPKEKSTQETSSPGTAPKTQQEPDCE